MLNEASNALAELISRRAREQRLTRQEIALRLGYKNINKGFTRFDQLFRFGLSTPDLLERLRLILAIDAAELAGAAAATGSMLRAQAKKFAGQKHEETQRAITRERFLAQQRFTPHLWVIPEREIPSPIFVVAIFGEERFRRVNLPETIATLPEKVQEKIISEAACSHFSSTGGRAGPFGKILAYLYRRTFDQSWRLNPKGEVLHRSGGSVPVAKCRLSFKSKGKKDVSILFK
jgi:hypothetical protein